MVTFCSRASRILGAALLIAWFGSAAAQQAYPSKPIRFITPFAAGGSTTVIVQIIGKKLTENWGQQVLVDNRPGGNTRIGTETLLNSNPDGHTLMLASINHALNPMLMSSWPFDPIKDFSLVSTVGSSEYLLALHPAVPANNLQEFISYAKSRPGQLNYSTPATGGPGHLAGEMFNIQAGVKLTDVPYKGGAPAVADLLGGHVQLSFVVPANVVAFVKAGKLKGIAISGKTRLAALPDVPTFAEQGLPNFEPRIWYGVVAPARTPRPVVDKLSAEIARIVAMSDVKQMFANHGLDTFSSTPEQFATLITVDTAKFAQVIKKAKIKVEN